MGLYVHFPWCLRKCPYCDFLSIEAAAADVPSAAYADAVIAELAGRRDVLGPRRIESVFFGGGTPSLWDPTDLGRVLRAALAAFPPDGDPEVTVECNPSSFSAEKARALLDVGVNRVSLGVQALDDERLSFLGRLHDAKGGLRALRDAVSVMPRVSADLIFGLHGQRAHEAVGDALQLADVGPAHLSLYALTIEPGTQFGALAKKGRLPLATEDDVADSFLALDEALSARGFAHYETSNYALSGQTARHNLGYWRGADYLGVGTGAWGTVTTKARRVRYRNTPSVERYLAASGDAHAAAFDAAHPLVSHSEEVDPETDLRERIMLGLRLAEGVALEAEADRLGVVAWTAERKRAAARLVERGQLAIEGGRVRVPRSAWLFADGIAAALF